MYGLLGIILENILNTENDLIEYYKLLTNIEHLDINNACE
jgi:hypothetical protein